MDRFGQPTLAAFLSLLLCASGCSICCSPYADDYVAFGSRTPRMDMKYGRVGSVFSDPQLTGTANGVPIDELQEIIVEPSIENDMETGSIDVGSFE